MRLRAADEADPLQPEDFDRLAARCVGRIDDSIQASEREHAGHLERGHSRRAGFAALMLAHDHSAKGPGSLANSSLRRADRLLAHEQDSVEYGHLLRARRLLAKDPDEGLDHGRAAYDLAMRNGEHDLAALELQEQGRLLIAKGRWPRGVRSSRRPRSRP